METSSIRNVLWTLRDICNWKRPSNIIERVIIWERNLRFWGLFLLSNILILENEKAYTLAEAWFNFCGPRNIGLDLLNCSSIRVVETRPWTCSVLSLERPEQQIIEMLLVTTDCDKIVVISDPVCEECGKVKGGWNYWTFYVLVRRRFYQFYRLSMVDN